MSLFGKLKNALFSKEAVSERKEITVYFENGLLTRAVPPPGTDLYECREIIYNARYIVSDGRKYDLENVRSIESIRSPEFDYFDNSEIGVTGNLVYILRMKASRLKKDGKVDVAIALLKRATEMMPNSKVGWTKKDYLRFPDWLCETGEFEAAKTARNCIEKSFETTLNANRQLQLHQLENAEKLNTDLVEANYFCGCCGECAKYRGRWFSISGKDGRFPKMPVDYGCNCQGISLHPVIENISKPLYCPENKDIVEYSNRPFIDDRDEKEKEIHQHYLDRGVFESVKYQDKEDYEKLIRLIPDEMPKSFSAYRRMKMSETDKFLCISEEASKLGMNIRLPEKEKLIIDRYNKYEKALKENNKTQ
ncbi:MAG: hypothetical protein IJX77_09630 [Ruminococcus sp.]|nr:hypothetical protein [Ruminococcus sp.]